LRDAAWRFETREGRSIVVLLRGLDLGEARPLTICDNQPLLFDRLEPRTRLVPWTHNSTALASTKWKLSIRRWKLVIARHEPANLDPLRRVFEPRSIKAGAVKDHGGIARAPLEHDLIPGEVTLKLAIDPTNPNVILVKINLDRSHVLEQRATRALRQKSIEESTPRGHDGIQPDPIEYRRDKLQKLQEAGEKNDDEIRTLKKEISELKEIHEILRIEDLLSKPVRAELSVVIGLDLGGSTMLDIVKLGEFAH
jgi:hypothetical protein